MAVDNADTLEIPASTTIKGSEPPRPFSSLLEVEMAALSHPGKVRPNNEDHFLVLKLGRYLDVLKTNLPEAEIPLRSEETCYGMVVADGMGGAAAGEVASRLAIHTLLNLTLELPDWILRVDDELAQKVMGRAVQRFRKIDARISREAKDDPKLSGMGTTMTLAYSLGDDLFIVHVGDSRVYLFREGRLWQLTHDHTLVQDLLEKGHLTREEASSNHLRHILTQALGQGGSKLEVEVQRLKLIDGDCLLLCTDGLTEMVADDQIAEQLGRPARAEDACLNLISLALERGGLDNITAIVARYRFPNFDESA
jgi:PPM family protein phosphatase